MAGDQPNNDGAPAPNGQKPSQKDMERIRFDLQVNELAKTAAQYLAIKTASKVTGGGLAGMLLSSVAMKGIDRAFASGKPQEAAKPSKPDADTSAEAMGNRIGDAAARAIDRILREKLPQILRPELPSGVSTDKQRPNADLEEIFGQRGKSEQQTAPQAAQDRKTQQNLQSAREAVRKMSSDERKAATSGQPVAESAASRSVRDGAFGGSGLPNVVSGGRAAGAAAETGGIAEGGAGVAGGAGIGQSLGAVAAPAAAIVGWLTMVETMRETGMKWAKEQEAYARKIGEVNPVIANQNAELDMNRMLRDIQSGNNMADSNQKLYDQQNALEEEFRPVKDAIVEIKNFVATDAIQFTRELLNIGKGMYEVNRQMYETVRQVAAKAGVDMPAMKDLNADKTPAGSGFGDFLFQVNKEIEQQKQDAKDRIDNARKARAGAFNKGGAGGGW